MSDTKEITTDPAQRARLEAQTMDRVVESLVIRGDMSGLSPRDRALHYTQVCRDLGLNPASQPFAYLRLNGKEVLYATRGCTDHLARIHRVTRATIDGPKVIDLAGTKLVFCVVKVSMPDGRSETATATVPLVDPVNVLMKCETKAKRRATLSILGLSVLDEMELETIPASAQEPGGGVDLSRANDLDEEPVAPPRGEVPIEPLPVEVPPALEGFYARVEEIELPGEGVNVWVKNRTDLASLPAPDREAAWKALCAKVETVGRMKNAKVWLKKAIAQFDADNAANNAAAEGNAA